MNEKPIFGGEAEPGLGERGGEEEDMNERVKQWEKGEDTHRHTHTRRHARTHARTHAHIHTHIHIHTNTHKLSDLSRLN